MARLQSTDEIFSALYVDFDSVYSRLQERNELLAKTFATNPQRWLRWIEGHALRMLYGEGIRRRILVRCCYMGPSYFQEFRPFFARAAFRVIECPHANSRGCTNADIRLVMDCMDAMTHPTSFDEFIILSGDTDFSPLLLRIQENAKRSLALSMGETSPAHTAACSWRIREDWFIAQALEEGRPEEGELKDDRSGDAAQDKEPQDFTRLDQAEE